MEEEKMNIDYNLILGQFMSWFWKYVNRFV